MSKTNFPFIPPTSRNLHRGTATASLATLCSRCIDVEELEAGADGAVAIFSFDPCQTSMHGLKVDMVEGFCLSIRQEVRYMRNDLLVLDMDLFR